MVDNSQANEIDLESFLKAAGQSFTDAQKALLPGMDVPVNMILSNADLEIKVAVNTNPQGKMSIRPVSSKDLTSGGIDPGLVSVVRISFVNTLGEIKPQPLVTTAERGEIKTPPAATPVDRGEIKTPPAVTTPARGINIPQLVGLSLEEAAALLKSGGWQFEVHAAGTKETESAGVTRLGGIIRQEPSAGQAVDKSATPIHFWAVLSNRPVKEIEGIGEKYSAGLAKKGLSTIGELSLAEAAAVASALRISQSRAQSLIDMAMLMSGLAVLGAKDQVIELLVKGAGVRSIQALAETKPEELFRLCQAALTSGKVKVPRGFSITAEEVKGWTKAAGAFQSL
ncbi:MAG TPA: PASTA domain-containing protein [Dehalococcoidales bacterium]|nr:PASTA domain-containing protein [Dehalococcoidales bacterium]